MGIAERKQREKAYREASIVEAAEKAFLAKGLIATTMDDIASEAELGKGTLYRHYRSKEEIMLAIREQALRKLHALYVPEAAGTGSGLARVLRMIRLYRAFVVENPAYFGFIAFFESPLATTSAEAMFGPTTAIDELYETVLQQGIQDGSVRADRKAAQLVSMLCAVCSGMMQYLVSKGMQPAGQQQSDLDELFETFLASVQSGLRNPGSQFA